MSTVGKYRAIQGTLPKFYDIARWNEKHYQQFIELAEHFTTKNPAGKVVFKFSPQLIADAEKDALFIPSHKTELLYRINEWTSDPKFNPKRFMVKFTAVVRTVGNYVKKHPSALAPQLKERIKDNPRLNWMVVNYSLYETKVGAPVVVPHSLDTTEGVHKQATRVDDPQVKLMNAMVHLADVFENLAKSITQRDIKQLETKDKIAALSKLQFVFSQRAKPTSSFKQINVFSASREDLEKAILELGDN